MPRAIPLLHLTDRALSDYLMKILGERGIVLYITEKPACIPEMTKLAIATACDVEKNKNKSKDPDDSNDKLALLEDEFDDLPPILTFTDTINIADDDGFNNVNMYSYDNSPTGTSKTAPNGSKHQSKSSKCHKHKSKSKKSGSARGGISETSAISSQSTRIRITSKKRFIKKNYKRIIKFLGKGKTFDKGRYTKIATTGEVRLAKLPTEEQRLTMTFTVEKFLNNDKRWNAIKVLFLNYEDLIPEN